MEIKVPIACPQVGEEEAEAVAEVVRSGWLNEGEVVRSFEEEFARYCGARSAVAFFNGTVALHSIMLAFNITAGDEVIVPSFTFISTANCARFVGAKPVFADIDPLTYNIDPEDVKERITSKTKAIIPVHYGGQMADMKTLCEIAEDEELLLVEDAAEAHGARSDGKHAGTFGDASMFSFTPTKNITTGEGAMVVTENDVVERRLRLLKNHGMESPYLHTIIGYNYRMTEMQGAMGRVQLRKLDSILERKRAIATRLDKGLGDISSLQAPFVAEGNEHSYMIYTILVKDECPISRDQLMEGLNKKGIQSKIYFPPVHLQPCYAGHGVPESLPVTEDIASRALSLPCHSGLKDNDLDYILSSISELI